tara:strand:- start:133 stop:399 length:267 start_codon:yes stop_codon:yes gene_type:complete
MKQIEQVKQLLTEHKFLRDDRTALVTYMLFNEGLSRYEAAIVAENFTKAASIVRASCRIQQTTPELRGKEYQNRQLRQDEIKKELGYE